MFASPQERKPGQGFDCYGGAAERALTVRYSALQAATVALDVSAISRFPFRA